MALPDALAAARLPRHQSPTLIRFGTNAVFRARDSHGQSVIVRLAAPSTDIERVRAEVNISRWLHERGFPVARPLTDALTVNGLTLSAWEYVPHDPRQRINQRDLGQLISLLHDITADFQQPLSQWDPLWKVGQRLGRLRPNAAVAASDIKLLRREHQRLTHELERLPEGIGSGVTHGDVHVGNVLASARGPVLIDFERIEYGPREWDLIPLAVGARRFANVSDSDYRQFSDGYGYDVTSWDGFETLARVRELSATSWLLALPQTPRTLKEASNRLRYWQGHPSPPLWSAV
jgi:Ser/Thr protein kinase RdoA (MazF antagonist)